MLRFIDLTDEASGTRAAGFLNTIDNRFVETGFGDHVFDSLNELPDGELGDRMRALLPPNFFAAQTRKSGTDAVAAAAGEIVTAVLHGDDHFGQQHLQRALEEFAGAIIAEARRGASVFGPQ
ncbi:hypothetical protein [Anatilimnocola floriformis]|uniref:hypothetical protein n=1 Tax=Anatilimnocola floriformis TaxID=2948575 RepID=UPI0020C45909|nr:hypothetical protein [Anatilimnocola floriformis]